MEQSNYIEYIRKFYPGVVRGIVETINGSTNPNQLTYLHKTMLRTEFSVSGKWEAVNINNVPVAADYVSMDASIPLKIRDTYGKASGDIPKMGTERQLNEQQLTDIDTMIATREPDDAIALKLFQDDKSCITGIYEKNEMAFLLGLSTGVTLVEDDKNVGTGIRVDYKYPTANKFGVPVVWSSTSSTPISDINSRILAKASADGKAVRTIMLDSATISNILKTDEAKNFFALSIGNYGSFKPLPSLTQLNAAVQAEYGFSFQKIDRTVMVERDGVRTAIKPWAAGAVVALTSDVVGTLTYAKLAEDNHRKAGVEYQKPDEYLLLSKFRRIDPALAEVTRAQARVLPVISETVYLMDSTTVQA